VSFVFFLTLCMTETRSSPLSDLHTPIHFWFTMTSRSVYSHCTYVWFGSCNFIFFALSAVVANYFCCK
jgi:hypothetical protein